MVSLFLVLLGVCCVLSFVSGRYWLGSILLIGFLQDPVRKFVPNEPVYFVVLVGVLFAFILMSQLAKYGFKQSIEPFEKWTSKLRMPITLFLIVLFLQFANSFFSYGNFTMSSIGLISYIAPLLAIVIGYSSVNSVADIRKFMKIYSAVGIALSLSVFLSFSGFDLQLFKEVGAGLKIYDQGTVLRSYSGFMRTGEIAAWHLATSACFLIILLVTSDKKPLILVAIVLCLVIAISLTGRRKMIMLISLFCVFFIISYLYYRQTINSKYAIASIVAMLIVWLGVEVFFPSNYDGSEFENYLVRGTSVYGNSLTRFIDLGLGPLNWAIQRVGILGGGLGIASQGSKLFGAVNVAGGSGEGGLGKIVVELGIPGLLVIFWLVVRFAGYLNRLFSLSAQGFVPRNIMPIVIGISAFLAVNALTFTIATQVYGDVFILLMLGLLSGFLFAIPKLVLLSLHFENDRPNSIDIERFD